MCPFLLGGLGVGPATVLRSHVQFHGEETNSCAVAGLKGDKQMFVPYLTEPNQ